MSLRIFYVSNYPLSGNLSPSINEMDFAVALERRFGDGVRFHLHEGPLEIDLPSSRTTYFAAPPPISRPHRFVSHAFEWAREVRGLIERHGAHVVVVRINEAPLKELLLARALPNRVFVKSSGKYWIDGPAAGLPDRVLRVARRRICESFFRSCAGVEAVTEGYRDFVVRCGVAPDRTFVVSNSASVERFRPDAPGDCPVSIPPDAFPVIGYAGSWPERRGGVEVLELVRRLRNDYPKVFGVVAGRSTAFQDLRRHATELELDERCAIPGWIEFARLPSLFRNIDLALNFIPDASIVGGNASMKARQCIAAGIPIVTHGSSNQFVADHDLGSLVERGDLDALEREVRKWVARIAQDRSGIRARLHDFARRNLSTARALEEREAYWRSLSGLPQVGQAMETGF
jgi:glycosyltransferase involved in cell wall biosynthesis